MKRPGLRLLVLLPLALLVGATAHKREQKASCENAVTQFEMNQCAHKEYLAADAELNTVYSRLVSKLEEEERAKLKEAELAWIKYRDANCEYEAFLYRGGTIRPLIHSSCLARMTKARTAELRQQIESQEQ